MDTIAMESNEGSSPKPFVYFDGDPEVLGFFHSFSKKHHLDQMEKSLQHLAKVQPIREDHRLGFRIIPALDPTSSGEGPKNHEEFETQCFCRLEEFLDGYTSKTEVFDQRTLDSFRRHSLDTKMDPCYAGNQDVIVKWTGESQEILVVTGVRAEVDSTMKGILGMLDVANNALTLQEGQYRWIIGCSEVSRKFDIGIECDDSHNTFTFTGDQRKVHDAWLFIEDALKGITSTEFKPSDKHQRLYLSNVSRHQAIVEQASKIFSRNNIRAILAFEKKTAFIWSHADDAAEAASAMESALVTDYLVKMASNHGDVLSSPSWKSLIHELLKEPLMELRKQPDNSILIVGFSDIVKKAKQRVEEFFDEILCEDFIEIDYGTAKHIVEHFPQFKTICERQAVRYTLLTSPNCGISLAGKKKELDTIIEKLVDWMDQSVYERLEIERYGIQEYFSSGEGKERLDIISGHHQCTILVGEKFWPEKIKAPCANSSKMKPRSLLTSRTARENTLTQACYTKRTKQAHVDGATQNLKTFQGTFSTSQLGNPSPRKNQAQRSSSDFPSKMPVLGPAGYTTPYGSFIVNVYVGDITDEKSDAIVNSTGASFNLSEGSISRAIIQKGGCQIQNEVLSEDLDDEFFLRVTSGGDLRCKNVFHIVAPDKLEGITDCVNDILEEAETQKCVSVSMPAIATGNHKLPSALVAKKMKEAFNGFAREHPQTSSLKVINVVIFEQSLISDFATELTDGVYHRCLVMPNCDPNPSIPASDVKEEEEEPSNMLEDSVYPEIMGVDEDMSEQEPESIPTYSPLIISVIQGDITDETSDAIVNSTGADFNLSQGMISKAIITKGGKVIQTEVSSATGTSLRVTSGGQLECKQILHVVIKDACDIKQRVVDILEMAERQQCASVSIPALGTGNLKLPSATVAELMREGLDEFSKLRPHPSYPRKANIVIFERTKVEYFENVLTDLTGRRHTEASYSFLPNEEVGHAPSSTYKYDEYWNSGPEKTEITSQTSSGGVGTRCRDEQIIPSLQDHPQKQVPVDGLQRNSGRIIFQLYSLSTECIEKAKREIEREIEVTFHSDYIEHVIIGKLNTTEVEEILSEILDSLHRDRVRVTPKSDENKFFVDGLKSEVLKAIKEIQRAVYEYSEAKSLKDHATYCWQRQTIDVTWVDFDVRTEKLLENAYQEFLKNPSLTTVPISVPFGKCRTKFIVNFHEMDLTADDKIIRIRRENKDELPHHWTPMGDELLIEVVLQSHSEEYCEVKNKICQTLPKCDIKSVTRIQNKVLYTQYAHRKKVVSKTSATRPMERQLFHGTTEAAKIIHNGFDRNYAGKNATVYGQGTYFAVKAEYSNRSQYARPDSSGVKTMLLADVITGDFSKGSSGLKSAPQKPGSKLIYDSLVDNVENPSIFVVFPDASVYPAYVIKYKVPLQR